VCDGGREREMERERGRERSDEGEVVRARERACIRGYMRKWFRCMCEDKMQRTQYQYVRIRLCVGITLVCPDENRLTQLIIYVPLQVNRFQESILLIVQYKCLKSYSGHFILHLILRTKSCGAGFITHSSWVFHFQPTIMVGWKYFVPQLYQTRRGISEGPGLKCFYMIHRGGRGVSEYRKRKGLSVVGVIDFEVQSDLG